MTGYVLWYHSSMVRANIGTARRVLYTIEHCPHHALNGSWDSSQTMEGLLSMVRWGHSNDPLQTVAAKLYSESSLLCNRTHYTLFHHPFFCSTYIQKEHQTNSSATTFSPDPVYTHFLVLVLSMSNRQLAIFDVAIIMEEVGRYLDREDLKACVLVNKSFQHHFQRLLWRRVEFPIRARIIAERGMPRYQELALNNNAHFLRHAFIHSSTRRGVIPLLVAKCGLLYGLRSHVITSKQDTNDVPFLNMLDLVHNNKRLRKWTMYTRTSFTDRALVRLAHVLANSRCLTALTLELAFRPRPGWMRYFLQNLPRTLKHLQIQWGIVMESDELGSPFLNLGWPTVYQHLETVELDIYLASGDEKALFQFLGRCPNLSQLTVPRMLSDLTVDSVISLLETKPLTPTLTTIDLRLVSQMDELRWVRFLRTMKGTVKELFTRMSFNTALTERHILKLTTYWNDTIESLHIGEPQKITGNDIYLILSTCTKLKKFQCLHPWVSVMFDEDDDDNDLIEYPGLEAMVRDDWVCTELEELELSFSDKRRLEAAEPVRSMQEGWCIQGIQHVYQQVGRLTKLRNLAIGWSTSKGFVDRANLDASLASGLGHLEGLKELTKLDVKHIRRVQIGVPEAEWMLKNWPALKEIRGTRRMDEEVCAMFLDNNMTLA